MNSEKKEDLVILTDEYPYGYCEYPFIRIELEELKKYYNIIFVSKIKEKKDELPFSEGIKAYHNSIHFGIMDKIATTLAMVCNADGIKEIGTILKEKKNVQTRFYISLSFFGVALKTKKLLDTIIKEQEAKPLIYSYWFSEQCMGALMLKRKYPDLKVISRIHGYDLYDERWRGSRHPFREQMDNRVDRLFFIAHSGKEYYSSVLNKHLQDGKYIYAPIGTKRGRIPTGHKTDSKEYIIVSCSSCIKIKRVDLIIEALSLITDHDIPETYRIRWVHFGDGDLYDYLRGRATELLNNNHVIEYELKGFVRNDDILDYYANNDVGCFITTSLTEGSPVSIQEAMGYGISVIGTRVGEIPNMIKDFGYIMGENPDPEEIKNTILTAYEDSQNMEKIKQIKLSAVKKWESEYNAERNSKEFVKELFSLQEK